MIIERFLQWVSSAPTSKRAEAAHALARSYLHSALAPEERDGVEAAMTVLLDDLSTDVRAALAEALVDSDQAPHHIIISLAQDQTRVASIVAERSPVLLDSELVDMIATREEAIQRAIARRPVVTRAVSAALSEVATSTACVELLCNPGARLARFSLDRIISRHSDDANLRDTLLARQDLPADIRQILVNRFACNLKDLIVERNWLTNDRADHVTNDARQRALISIADGSPETDLASLVKALSESEELNASLLIRAVASGQTAFFVEALASLARVPQERVAALIMSGRSSGIRAILEKAGLPEKTHPVFTAAIGVMRDAEHEHGPRNDYRRATHLIDAIVTQYGSKPDRELDQILALLRRVATEARRDAARGYVAQVMQAA
ncbi:MAG TPA: DUF2336 domain-containing protein [Afifellaceae bacterium]|nr:DUF2336 domain-containing protein [Afifellaceae bacterium]